MPATTTTVSATSDDSCNIYVRTVSSVPVDTRRLVPTAERLPAVVMARVDFVGATMWLRSVCTPSLLAINAAHARPTVLRI
jgi:hypothetical protein